MTGKPCTECIKGTIHGGQPQGKEEMIHGLNTYVVGNRTDPRAIIVVYSDIFGLPLPNNKLIADAYAQSGEFLVYLPDFFEGDPMPLSFADVAIPVDAAKQSRFAFFTGMLASAPKFVMWLTRHKQGPTDEVCSNFLRSLRKATPYSRKIGMVGFCWGGRYALRAALEDHMMEVDGKKVPLVDAVAVFHPSNLVLPDDVENIVVPTTYGWGEEDQGVNIKQKGEVEEIHAKAKRSGRQVPEQVHQVYKPGRHGFGVRGNPDDPQERKCLEDTEKQALAWMDKYL